MQKDKNNKIFIIINKNPAKINVNNHIIELKTDSNIFASLFIFTF